MQPQANRPRLGVMIMPMTPQLRDHFGAQNDRGVLVGTVEPGSAAQRGGIQVGDVITEVNGSAVRDARDVIMALKNTRQGQRVSLHLLRDGRPMTITVMPTAAAQRNQPLPGHRTSA